MLKTPEEKLEHLFDEFIWAWYATCLPTDRRKAESMTVPAEVFALLTSQRIATLIMTRYHEGLARHIQSLSIQAHWYFRHLKTTWYRWAGDGFQMASEDIRHMKKEFFQYQLRSLLLPETVEEMRDHLRAQAPWMYAMFTTSEREFLADIAAWHKQQP